MKEKEIINEYFSKYYPKRNYVYNEVFELIAGLFLGFFFSALKDSISNRALSVVRSFEQPQVSAQFFKDSEKLVGELGDYAKQNKELQERLEALEETLNKLKDAAVEVQEKGPQQTEAPKDVPVVTQTVEFTTEFAQILTEIEKSRKADKEENKKVIDNLTKALLNTMQAIGLSQSAIQKSLDKILKEAQKKGEVTKEQAEEVQTKFKSTTTATKEQEESESTTSTQSTKEKKEKKPDEPILSRILEKNQFSLNSFLNGVIKKAEDGEKTFSISKSRNDWSFTFVDLKGNKLTKNVKKEDDSYIFKLEDSIFEHNKNFSITDFLNFYFEQQEVQLVKAEFISNKNEMYFTIKAKDLQRLDLVQEDDAAEVKVKIKVTDTALTMTSGEQTVNFVLIGNNEFEKAESALNLLLKSGKISQDKFDKLTKKLKKAQQILLLPSKAVTVSTDNDGKVFIDKKKIIRTTSEPNIEVKVQNPEVIKTLKNGTVTLADLIRATKITKKEAQLLSGPEEEPTSIQSKEEVTVDSVLNGKTFNFYNFIGNTILGKPDKNLSTISFSKEGNNYKYEVSINNFPISASKVKDYKDLKSTKTFLISSEVVQEHKSLSVSNLLHIFEQKKEIPIKQNHFTLNDKKFEGSFKASEVEVKFNENKNNYEITFPVSFLEQVSTKLTEFLNEELKSVFIDKYFSAENLLSENKVKLSDAKAKTDKNIFYFSESKTKNKYSFTLFLDDYTLTLNQVINLKSKEFAFENFLNYFEQEEQQNKNFFNQVTFNKLSIEIDVEKSDFQYLTYTYKLPKRIFKEVQSRLLEKFNEKVKSLNEEVTNLLNKKFSLDSLLSGENLKSEESDNYITVQYKYETVSLELILDGYDLTESKINTLDNKELAFESLLIKHLFEQQQEEKATKVTNLGRVSLEPSELQELAENKKFSTTVVQKIKEKLLEFLKEQQKIDAELKKKEDKETQSGSDAKFTSNEKKPEDKVQKTSEPVETKKAQTPKKWPKELYTPRSLKVQIKEGYLLKTEQPKELGTYVRFKLKDVAEDKSFATYVGEVQYDETSGVTKTDLSSILEAVLNQERGKQLTVTVTYKGKSYFVKSVTRGKLTDSSSSLLTKVASTGSIGANKGIAEEPFAIGTLSPDGKSVTNIKNYTSIQDNQTLVLVLPVQDELALFLKLNKENLTEALTSLRTLAKQKTQNVKVYTQTGKTFTLAKFNREKFLNNLQTVVNKLKLLFNKQDYNDSLVQSRKKTLTQREVLFGRVEGYSASEGFKSTYKLNSLDTEQTPVQPKTVEELEKRSQKLGYEIQQQKNKLGRS